MWIADCASTSSSLLGWRRGEARRGGRENGLACWCRKIHARLGVPLSGPSSRLALAAAWSSCLGRQWRWWGRHAWRSRDSKDSLQDGEAAACYHGVLTSMRWCRSATLARVSAPPALPPSPSAGWSNLHCSPLPPFLLFCLLACSQLRGTSFIPYWIFNLKSDFPDFLMFLFLPSHHLTHSSVHSDFCRIISQNYNNVEN